MRTDGHGRARTSTTDTNITPHPPTKTKYRAAKREASARRKQRKSPAEQHRSDATRAVAPRRSATPKAPGPDVRAQARREHARVHGPAVRRTRRTAQPLDHPGRHADEGQPGDAKVRSRANRRNAPRAPQPTGEEAVRLSRRACAHPPPALLRAHRRSMGAKLMHGGRRLSECAKDKANTLRERAQEAEDRPSTNKASTHSVAAHTVVTLIEATGQSLVCSRHRPGTCRYRRSSRAACLSTKVVVGAVVDGFKVEQEAVRPARVVTVGEGHVAEAKVRNDAKPTRAHTTNRSSRQRRGKQVTRLQVTTDAAVSEVTVEHTEDRIVVIIPPTPRKVSARELNTVLVTDAVLRGPVGDAPAGETDKCRRRQAKVGSHHLGEFGVGDGVFDRRPSGDPLRAESITREPRMAQLSTVG